MVRAGVAVRYVVFGVGLERVQQVAFTKDSCAFPSVAVPIQDFDVQTDKRISIDIAFSE